MNRPSPQRRRLAVRLLPLLAALGALPLMAPTCGDSGEGSKTFARNSLIIPMDVCYQRQADTRTYSPAACPQAPDDGDVIKAYGLVYQLIRNNIAVYWIIDNAKTAVNGIDLTIQYTGGFPALFYDWTPENPPPASPPTTQHAIDYRGGPFVVDGSDYARASQVLQAYRSTFQNVNVHVSNVAFRAYAKRTMAGGWNAGGTVAPKVALLDIGSTSGVSGGYAKNSEPIIRGYLARAGLDFAGAGGVATDTGHGEIYDRLGMADLQPTTPGGSWTTTNLYKYGYQILWVPHWFAPGSCEDASSQSRCVATLYPLAQRNQALETIASFVAAEKDLFAECAGVGSFEGQAGSSASNWSASYSTSTAYHDPSTHFHVTNGININNDLDPAVLDSTSASSPLLQVGDFGFYAASGAIQNWRPAVSRTPASTYQAGVKRLVTDSADPDWDYFTYRPPTTGRGTTVYLGGHVYSGYSDTLNADGSLRLDAGSFSIGGTRLVLNTLFNLGATCTSSGVSCNTGQLGVCAAGTLVCQAGQPVCSPAAGAVVEGWDPGLANSNVATCNGLDDDCDGSVDEDFEVDCYDGPPATRDVGLCRSGIRSCVQLAPGTYGMSACTGQVLPATEVCNGLDDDCDGLTDETLSQPCYEGPSSTVDPATGQPRPLCQAGTQTCNLGSWGACVGQVLPRPEICDESGTAYDDDCDGVVNDNCGCTNGQTRACYSGPPGTAGVGICLAGTQTCSGAVWGPCAGEVVPGEENCATPEDENCDTLTPPCPECTGAQTEPCYPGDAGDVRDAAPSQCRSGTRTCVAEAWGACTGAVLPSPIEACDAVDNDCDGTVDGPSAVCPATYTCLDGVCVPATCGGAESVLPEGYVCNAGSVEKGACGDILAGCPSGETCRWGTCNAACTDLDGDGLNDQCATGSICAGGGCVAGGCYDAGCGAGEVCRNGACATDPCQGLSCPTGTFCRAGDCVQACTFVTCAAGQRCGIDGFCEADACAGRTCPPGQRCRDGACGVDPCVGLGCAAGQVCTLDGGGDPVCVDDPCTGVTCPAGVCSGGQCYPTDNPTGSGVVPGDTPAEGGCGCGSGSGAALPALLALLAAPLLRRRRLRPAAPLGVLLLAVALLGTACKEDEPAPFDPSACQETCGEQRCIDVMSDEAHCGGCGLVCGGICGDGECGAIVAPRIGSISPASGARGSLVPVTVQIAGERFLSGASVRLFSDTTSWTFPATFVSASQLSAELDLSAADPSATWKLRVVNPDHVISNAKPFDVLVPYPAVSSVTPSSITAGTTTVVLLAGTGFTSNSQCKIRSGTFPETGFPSTVDASGVHCTVNAASIPPGAYEIWVVNEGNLASNVRQLQVVSSAATLVAVSPSSGPELATVSLTVTGTGFDVSSRVLLDGCAGPYDPPSCTSGTAPFVGTTFVSPTTLVAGLLLPACSQTSCAHTISVRTGTGATTSTLPFTVAADQPNITSLAPATAYQGDNPLTLVFTGTSFITPTAIQVQAPGSSTFDPITMTTSGSSTVSAGTISLVGRPEGSWLARIDFGSGMYSAAWPFRVLSNQAILRDYDPRTGKAGDIVSPTFQVANLRPPYAGVRVILFDPDGVGTTAYTPSPAPTTATSPLTVSVSLAGRNTGTYSFKVRNPNGATDSNALSFAVTPGMPTVSQVCRLDGTACAATNPTRATQQSAPVPVRITGTNFAKPDASGNGSTVMVTANVIPGFGTGTSADLCPATGSPPFVPAPGTVEVRSPTEIVVQLDTLSAVALAGGTVYYVAVWNPGGSPPPQKSNGCQLPAQTFTIDP